MSVLRSIVGATVFRLIQIALLPLGIISYVIFVVNLVAYSRRTGSAATVLASLYTRYMQHMLGERRDAPAARLMTAMPNVSPLGLRLTTVPTLAANGLTGYVPKIYRYPYVGTPPMNHQATGRTTFYDMTVQRYLAAGIDQLVILGAGFDTRAYRLPANASVRCFEIAAPKTQAFKREMLAKAGIDARRVTFVPADFEQEDWLEKLTAAGFDPDKPSIFIWESVTMYLEPSAVESTLRKIAGLAPGTALAFDYFSAELLESRSLFMRYARAVIKLTGEPWKFGIDNTPPARERVAEFLASCGLTLEEQRNFGPETARKGPPAGFAIASVSSAAPGR